MQGREVPPSYFQLIINSCAKLYDYACVGAYSKHLKAPRDPILIDPIFKREAIIQANANSQ